MKKLLLCVMGFMLAFSINLTAQNRTCVAHEKHLEHMASDPAYAEKQAAIERVTQNYTQNANQRQANGQIIIPCIVHVVYANSQENISDAQVQSQIDRLNKDFSATNADYNQVPSIFTSVRSGDTDIRFELIETKRYSDSRATWGTNDAVKSSYPPIEPSRILNMWVADIGGGILGYAQFPGDDPATDGVVMSPQYFGDATVSGGGSFYLSAPFNEGRTATHEVGHWLNLRHIWGDGNCNQDDFVSDTPDAGNPNYGCPSAGTNSCSGGQSDMFMNYMDYVDDACMFMFSAGQDARMQATFTNGGGREGFLLDPTYTPGGGGGGGGGTTCDLTEVSLSLTTDQYASETSWDIKDSNGSVVESGSGYGNNATNNIDICLADGDYTFTIYDSYGDGICCQYGNGSYTLTEGSTTIASGGSFGSNEATTFTIGSGSGGGGGGTPGSTVLFSNSFETGLEGWADGGSDCFRYSGTRSYEGSYSIRIRDNTNTSVMTSSTFDASSYDQVDVEFYFYANSMENGEDFWVQLNNGSGWQTIATYARGTNFNNGEFYSATVSVNSGLTSNSQLRFRCDASGNNDQIYIDKVTVTGVTGNARTAQTITSLGDLNRTGLGDADSDIVSDLDGQMMLYPNPAQAVLNITLDEMDGTSVQIFTVNGQLVKTAKVNASQRSINIADLKAGIYVVKAVNAEGSYVKKFVKQ